MKIRFLSFCVLLFLFSCKTTHVVISKKNLKLIQPSNLIDSLNANSGNFAHVLAKCKLTVTVNKKITSLFGNIKIARDSAIWFSLNPGLGIEVARGVMTHDSVVVLERLKSSYYRGNYASINDLVNVDVDFNFLQSILLNTFYFYNSNNTDFLKNLTIEKDKNGKEIEITNISRRKARKADSKEDFSQIYEKMIVDNTNLKIKELLVKDFKDNKTLKICYNDYIYIDTIKAIMPNSISINIDSKKSSMKIDLKYSKFTFDVINDYSISIPHSYKPMLKD